MVDWFKPLPYDIYEKKWYRIDKIIRILKTITICLAILFILLMLLDIFLKTSILAPSYLRGWSEFQKTFMINAFLFFGCPGGALFLLTKLLDYIRENLGWYRETEEYREECYRGSYIKESKSIPEAKDKDHGEIEYGGYVDINEIDTNERITKLFGIENTKDNITLIRKIFEVLGNSNINPPELLKQFTEGKLTLEELIEKIIKKGGEQT